MLDGATLLELLKQHHVSHVVWLPDSCLGRWERELAQDRQVRLIRVSREGEAIGVAAGLMLGGKRPVVTIQCTGLFEAGDALRNVVYDLGLPLFLIVGIRSWQHYQAGLSQDSAARFAIPILEAWQIPYVWLSPGDPAGILAQALRDGFASRAQAVLVPE